MVLELILHDVAQYILDVESGSTYLLRNEARHGHTWSGIDLQHIDHILAVLVLGDDVVDTDDSVSMQNVVNARSGLCHLFCSLG